MRRLFLPSTLSVLFLLILNVAQAQRIGINETGASPHSSSILDISSSSKGLLIPRLNKAQRTAIATPAEGLIIYQLDDTIGFWYYEQNKWIPLMKSLTAGTGLTGGNVLSSGTINVSKTGIGAGNYGSADSFVIFSVNDEGRLITAAVFLYWTTIH